MNIETEEEEAIKLDSYSISSAIWSYDNEHLIYLSDDALEKPKSNLSRKKIVHYLFLKILQGVLVKRGCNAEGCGHETNFKRTN